MLTIDVSRRGMLALPLLLSGVPAEDAPPDVLATYRRFLAAQNARDLPAVRGFLLDSPDFLWVSNGMSFWGRETMLRRFAGFQELEVWEARVDFDRMRGIVLGPEVAMLHFPLELALGARPTPDRIPFLVSALFRRVRGAWLIAALLTTTETRAT